MCKTVRDVRKCAENKQRCAEICGNVQKCAGCAEMCGDLIFDTDIDQGLITEYDEEEEEVSRGTTPATGNTTENDEDHNKKGEEKPSKSTVGDNHNNSDSDLHMDDAQ
ncbi:unnamed protein product [Rhizophagus irregularis]|nr:unnamed protein product [Rhizophagus irregularis]